MAAWWERAIEIQGLSEEVAKERRRVLQLIDAHQHDLGMLHVRLSNLIANGVDLEEEAKRPIDDRAMGFHWPDE